MSASTLASRPSVVGRSRAADAPETGVRRAMPGTMGIASSRPSRSASTADVPVSTTSALVWAASRAQSARISRRDQRRPCSGPPRRSSRRAAAAGGAREAGRPRWRWPRRPCPKRRRRREALRSTGARGITRHEPRGVPRLGALDGPQFLDDAGATSERASRHASSLSPGRTQACAGAEPAPALAEPRAATGR